MYSRLLGVLLIMSALGKAEALGQAATDAPTPEVDTFDVKLNCTPDAYFQVEPVDYYNGNRPYHLSNYGAQTAFNKAFVKAWRWGRVKLYTDSAFTQRYKFRHFKKAYPRYKRLKKWRFWRKEDTLLYDLQIEILRHLTYRFGPGYASYSDKGYKIGIQTYNPPSVHPPIQRDLELFVEEDDLMKVVDELLVRRAYDGILEHSPQDILQSMACTFTVEDCYDCDDTSFIDRLNVSGLARGEMLFTHNWPAVQTKGPVWYRTPFAFHSARYSEEGLHDALERQYEAGKTTIKIMREYIAKPLLEAILKEEIDIYQTGALEQPQDIEIIYNYIENHPQVPSRPTRAALAEGDFSVGLQDIEVGGTLTRRTKQGERLSTRFTPQYLALGWNAYGEGAASASLGVVTIADASAVVGKIDGQSLQQWLRTHDRLAYPVQVHKSYPPSASQAMLLNLNLSLLPWDELPPPDELFGETDTDTLQAKFDALVEEMADTVPTQP